MKTLIVDNEAICRMALAGMLKPRGQVDAASSAKAALELFAQALKSGERYDLVCLDVMMPEMDGHEALQELRSLEAQAGIPLGHGAKVVMITASASNDDVMNAFRSNCDAYLVKPVLKSKLEELLSDFGIGPA